MKYDGCDWSECYVVSNVVAVQQQPVCWVVAVTVVVVVLAGLVVDAAPNEARLKQGLFPPFRILSQQPMNTVEQRNPVRPSRLTFLFEMFLRQKGKSAALVATKRQSYCRNEDQRPGRIELSCSSLSIDTFLIAKALVFGSSCLSFGLFPLCFCVVV